MDMSKEKETQIEGIVKWLSGLESGPDDRSTSNAPPLPLDLGPITALLASDSPIVSNAQLTGDIADEVIRKSRELKNIMETGDLAKGLEYFKNTPLDGCTSIMDMARTSSGYNPLDPNASKNLNRFKKYASHILESPVFEQQVLDVRPFSWNNRSWQDSINRISGLFQGITGNDLKKIRTGIKRMAQAAASHPGSVQQSSFFNQQIIQAESGAGKKDPDYSAHMYLCYVQLREIQRHKQDPVRETSLQIARARLLFKTELWPGFAEEVWNRHVCTVIDWLEQNTTKPGNQAANLCFDE